MIDLYNLIFIIILIPFAIFLYRVVNLEKYLFIIGILLIFFTGYLKEKAELGIIRNQLLNDVKTLDIKINQNYRDVKNLHLNIEKNGRTKDNMYLLKGVKKNYNENIISQIESEKKYSEMITKKIIMIAYLISFYLIILLTYKFYSNEYRKY
jgi:hypothetical protein